MPREKKIVFGFVALWLAICVATYFATTSIDGPRNIDTGFQRLDVLVRYQIVALSVAAVAAILGIVWRRRGKRIMLIGLIPVLTTVLLILLIIVATWFYAGTPTSENPGRPLTPTLPAEYTPVQE